jgi:hypothetical protein
LFSLAMAQSELFDVEFQTARPPNPLFCHTDFLEKLALHRSQPLGKRATLLLQRLAVDERRLHYKATHGINRGWRRSRLGGTGGSHFYAWWATRGSQPLRQADGFTEAPEGSIFLRDIRHHDDHSPLSPQSLGDSYLSVTVPEIRREEYSPQPWTSQQAKFASSRMPIRLLKGHPGSGKTTALLHAADSTDSERILYLTYSPDLAALARNYFDRYCASSRSFSVAPFGTFVRQWLGSDQAAVLESVCRRRFQTDLFPFLRYLGPWSANPEALYDELYAHLIGEALPEKVGRFAACGQPRVPDAVYLQRRSSHLGVAAKSAADAASRLEKADRVPLAERYFPELALAWKAAITPVPPEFLEFDCIAVDECQDLTPLETLLIARIGSALQKKRRSLHVPVLLAGDEAQTVRPTDFEWGWLSELLHSALGTPVDFKLGANLRSPRRIAELVNRVWDLYSQLDKRDRPSGTGYAEIDDDSTDQLFYCTATAGDDLNALLTDLATREGLALICFDGIPPAVPESLRGSILTPAEAKGLDFHSVCVLDAGRQLHKVLRMEVDRHIGPGNPIEGLRKRLAIDQMRVALSRPAERLLWLDISPNSETVREALEFLNGHRDFRISTCSPAALLKTLSEEDLDLEERIQRCQQDARQYLAVRPDLAWSRAQQAVSLLGERRGLASVTDEAVRGAAWLTLAEICFCLGYRKLSLSPEFGRPDLFEEARKAAIQGMRPGLSGLLAAIGRVQRAGFAERASPIFDAVRLIAEKRDDVEAWVLMEIGPQIPAWLDVLESSAGFGNNASLLLPVLPKFIEAAGLPDGDRRMERLRKRTIDTLLKNKDYKQALEVLQHLPQRDLKLEGACYQAIGAYPQAAAIFRQAGMLPEALDCYRLVPDFESALSLIREIGAEHPASASLEWVARMQQLIAERPENFLRVMKPSEKKLLEQLLEDAVGGRRAKPAAKKPAPKKPTARKKAPSTKPAATKRVRPRDPF